MLAYHVTGPAAAEQLLTYGFSLDGPAIERNYPWSSRCLYLWPELEQARAWAADPEKKPYRDALILSVDIPDDVDVYDDEYAERDPRYAKAAVIFDDLDPKAFCLVEPALTLEQLSSSYSFKSGYSL